MCIFLFNFILGSYEEGVEKQQKQAEFENTESENEYERRKLLKRKYPCSATNGGGVDFNFMIEKNVDVVDNNAIAMQSTSPEDEIDSSIGAELNNDGKVRKPENTSNITGETEDQTLSKNNKPEHNKFKMNIAQDKKNKHKKKKNKDKNADAEIIRVKSPLSVINNMEINNDSIALLLMPSTSAEHEKNISEVVDLQNNVNVPAPEDTSNNINPKNSWKHKKNKDKVRYEEIMNALNELKESNKILTEMVSSLLYKKQKKQKVIDETFIAPSFPIVDNVQLEQFNHSLSETHYMNQIVS